MIHLRHPDERSWTGIAPLCGRADYDNPDGLTIHPERNECWECASIAGAYSPELQERFGLNADGSERSRGDTDADVLYALNDAIGQVSADWGLLDRFEGDDRDAALNEAVHAAFIILVDRRDD